MLAVILNVAAMLPMISHRAAWLLYERHHFDYRLMTSRIVKVVPDAALRSEVECPSQKSARIAILAKRSGDVGQMPVTRGRLLK